jgi:hypothetical protein
MRSAAVSRPAGALAKGAVGDGGVAAGLPPQALIATTDASAKRVGKERVETVIGRLG